MKKAAACLLSLILAVMLAGCAGFTGGQDQEAYYLYYISSGLNQVTSLPYTPEHQDTENMIAEFVAMQQKAPEDEEAVLLLPEGTSIRDWSLDGETLTLNMSSSYAELSPSREILARAGLVRTFTQVSGVSRVRFMINGSPLTDSSGNEIGSLTDDSFVENSGQELNTYQNTTMRLYFTDKSGTELVPEERTVYYSSNVPLERVVVEELVKGPREEDHYPTLSAETNILSVSIQEGICYVNFDESFTSSVLSVSDEIPIYSIVNSLSSVCHVNRVQFSINGSTSVVFRDSLRLDQLFEQDPDLVRE
jgi:germination protein M